MKCEELLLEWPPGADEIHFDDWEDLTDALTEIMQTKNPLNQWKARVENFGWTQQGPCYKKFEAKTGQTLLREILPDTECSFKIYDYGKGIAINNAHHDSPCWAECYYVLPVKEFDSKPKF